MYLGRREGTEVGSCDFWKYSRINMKSILDTASIIANKYRSWICASSAYIRPFVNLLRPVVPVDRKVFMRKVTRPENGLLSVPLILAQPHVDLQILGF